MYDICILTTAIIRPKIHILSMNSLKKILKRETKIYWIINIDFVNTEPKYIKTENLSENYIANCLNYTEENFKNIFKNFKNIEFKFIKNIKGNFNIAVRTLLNNCVDVIEKIKYGVLYLEDDWVVTKNITCINNYFGSFEKTPNCLGISFNNNSRIGFKPCLWNNIYFKEIFFSTFIKIKEENIDPEQLIRDFNKYGFKEEDLLKNNKFIEKSKYIFFEDIGINWRNSKRLIKWNWCNDVPTYK